MCDNNYFLILKYTGIQMIVISLHYKRKVYQFHTYEDEYDSLMCLISDHFPVRCFGVCYGGGCCGTCGVFVMDNQGSQKFELSCEIRIDAALNGKVFILEK